MDARAMALALLTQSSRAKNKPFKQTRSHQPRRWVVHLIQVHIQEDIIGVETNIFYILINYCFSPACIYHLSNKFYTGLMYDIQSTETWCLDCYNSSRLLTGTPFYQTILSSLDRCPLVRGSIKCVHDTCCKGLQMSFLEGGWVLSSVRKATTVLSLVL